MTCRAWCPHTFYPEHWHTWSSLLFSHHIFQCTIRAICWINFWMFYSKFWDIFDACAKGLGMRPGLVTKDQPSMYMYINRKQNECSNQLAVVVHLENKIQQWKRNISCMALQTMWNGTETETSHWTLGDLINATFVCSLQRSNKGLCQVYLFTIVSHKAFCSFSLRDWLVL